MKQNQNHYGQIGKNRIHILSSNILNGSNIKGLNIQIYTKPVTLCLLWFIERLVIFSVNFVSSYFTQHVKHRSFNIDP
jgi:hypothetical protein